MAREKRESFIFSKIKGDAADSAARPEASGKSPFFPRNDRPSGLKGNAFQTENALEQFNFEM
ncbi:hypothetical protein QUW15_09895 [Desulfovibrio piger]|nr:hypothetical protein [Desulfovibrio piger]